MKSQRRERQVRRGRRELQEQTRPHPDLLQTAGNRYMVVLRVKYLQHEPSLSASELQGRIFGKGDNTVTVSLRGQMEACSAGQLSLRAY